MSWCLTCGKQFAFSLSGANPGGKGRTGLLKCAQCTQATNANILKEIAQRKAHREALDAKRRAQEAQDFESAWARSQAQYYERDCPLCAERVKKKAKICEHCRHEFIDYAEVIKRIEKDVSDGQRFSVPVWEVERTRNERARQCATRGCADHELDAILSKEKQAAHKIQRLDRETKDNEMRKNEVTLDLLITCFALSWLGCFTVWQLKWIFSYITSFPGNEGDFSQLLYGWAFFTVAAIVGVFILRTIRLPGTLWSSRKVDQRAVDPRRTPSDSTGTRKTDPKTPQQD
jgi:hypothetical protein